MLHLQQQLQLLLVLVSSALLLTCSELRLRGRGCRLAAAAATVVGHLLQLRAAAVGLLALLQALPSLCKGEEGTSTVQHSTARQADFTMALDSHAYYSSQLATFSAPKPTCIIQLSGSQVQML